MVGRKSSRGSGGAAAAPAKESGKGKGKEKEKAAREDGKERAKEKLKGKGKEKEVREGVMEPAKDKQKQNQKGKEKEVREGSKEPAKEKQKEKEIGKEKEVREPAKEKQKQKGKGKEVREDGKEPAKEKQKQQGKEKEKEKEVREGGKEPAQEKQKEAREKQPEKEAAAGKSAGQQFFKIFFSDQSGERLKIPTSFHKHLKDQPTGLVSLKGPSGNMWQAVLTSDSAGLCFGHGWKEFVIDHSVQQGHFLVFTYDGLSQFSVTVFGSLGVVDPLALVAKPSNEIVVVDPLALVAKPSNEIVIKIEDDEGAQEDIGSGGTSETSILPPEESNGITGKRTRGLDDVLADGNASKRHSSVANKAEKKRPDAIIRTSKDTSIIVNNEKDTAFSLLDESTAGNKTQVRDKNLPKLGKFILKRARQPAVISQRRPVTEEEKDFALRRAKEFKSKNPFAVQTMMESYVYVGFFMNITCEFVRESLPRTSKKMTLWDPLGKPWEVNYVYYSDRSVASFSGGWGKFALGNNLEKFDVCVFELFKEDNIKVHIYRVVPEITPLLRASSRD